MKAFQIKMYDGRETVDCPDLGYRQDIVNCYRCKYFKCEDVEQREEDIYEEVIKCKFDEREEDKNNEESKR